ncbi:phosphatase PAP2 family protein [Nocardia mikamii]|uniref:phosphatase PAP2 family protein n=1 Tax=Nocardia mikamii TaxID=508464 RepID=UPI0007A546C3|nr:phosphatase PAP2 family protein [Nocardia mikamii]
MSAIVDVLRGLVDEVRTESSSAEVGVGAAAVATAVLVVSVLLGRGGDSSVWGSRVGWSALRAAVVAALFVVMGVQVAASGWLTGADTATLQWFVDHRDGTATALARVITDLGSPVGVAAVAVVVSGVSAWRSRSAVPAVFVVGAVGFAAVVSTVTKDVVGRARPPAVLHLMAESDFSFPSGHTTGTTVLVGAVLVLYVLARPRRARTALASVSAAVIVAVVAATRLYLGVHWLTDVVGGAVLGTAVTLAATTVLLWLSPTTAGGRCRRSGQDTGPIASPDRRRDGVPGVRNGVQGELAVSGSAGAEEGS